MPMRFSIANSDINVWGPVLNDALRVALDAGHIYVVANANNPPTIKAGTRFTYYKTGSYTPPATPATGNTAYPAATAKTHNQSEVIAEPADRTFSWSGSGGTGATLPASGNSKVYYMYCTGADDVATPGLGVYNVNETAPTWDAVKGGWYSAQGRVIATFATDASGNVYGVRAWDLGNPFDDTLLTAQAQASITGGGVMTYTLSGGTNYIKWPVALIVKPVKRPYATDGYFTIDCPTSGDVSVYGGAVRTATSNGIPFEDGDSLFYKLPWGAANTSVQANLLILPATLLAKVDLNGYVMIAHKNATTKQIRLGNGKHLRTAVELTNTGGDYAASGTRLITGWSVLSDAWGEFDAANSKFVSKKAQTVQIDLSLDGYNPETTAGRLTNVQLYLYKGGSKIRALWYGMNLAINSGTSGLFLIQASTNIELAVNDELTFYITIGSYAIKLRNLSTENYMSIREIY